jgi:hypothetical protein
VTTDAFTLTGTHPADRLWDHPALQGAGHPTRPQVAAVLRALADQTHTAHMLSDAVAALGTDAADLGPQWAHATALTRYLHALADHLDPQPRDTRPDPDPVPGTDQPCHLRLPHDAHRWDTTDRVQLRYACPGSTNGDLI